MKEIMNKEQLSRTLKRMTHEIIEKNNRLEPIVLLGILKKGYPLAKLLQKNLKDFADVNVLTYPIDIKAYRDDINKQLEKVNQGFDLSNKTVIIVDDVLYTGRSVRAAMDAINDHGRPEKIELAILIDRGHRQLPIRADFIGKNIPTSINEKVVVDLEKLVVTIDE
ncbi:MAG: bifunctional pyr operon transcriptional regulator/uracil phosphoribosyltransferase PyrR [Acholeplasmataceae bacterium]|nr:bifunctional pyr operon transcriptional regulator/uracil phosphoribosyltransferase PyrR [Acholeplasmataceae bacterium]